MALSRADINSVKARMADNVKEIDARMPLIIKGNLSLMAVVNQLVEDNEYMAWILNNAKMPREKLTLENFRRARG